MQNNLYFLTTFCIKKKESKWTLIYIFDWWCGNKNFKNFNAHLKQNKDLDPSKQTILKMEYIGKNAYNISGSIWHLRLSIPLNKSITNFKPLHDGKCDVLTKQYTHENY